MSKLLKKVLLILFLFFALLLNYSVIADPPDPPGTPGNHGSNGNQGPPPLGAPVDGGMSILLALGLGYGAYKTYRVVK